MQPKTILALAVCVLGNWLIAQELFHIPWDEKESGFVSRQPVGDLCGGDTTLGPQAVGADQKGNVYLLDNLQQRILLFTKEGKYLKTLPCGADGCGLAVSPAGILAVFSPMGKTVSWINGPLVGKVVQMPAAWAALSEVWWEDNQWWGRYGSEVASVEDSPKIRKTHAAMLTDENKIALRMVSGLREDYFLISWPSPCGDAWVLGGLSNPDKACVAVRTNGHLEIFVGDALGNVSEAVAVAKPKDIFYPYAITPDASIYQIKNDESGLSVSRFLQPQKLMRKLAVMPLATGQGQELFQTKANSADKQDESASVTGDRGIPENIYVFFSSENKVHSVNLQNYVKGVVSAEIYANWHIEAHKAMAVAARTYAIARTRHPSTSPQAMVCTTTHCQAWTANINPNAEAGVNATPQITIFYNGTRITEPLYFAHCNGRTRNSEDYNGWNYVAYLRSTSCVCGYTSYYGHGVGVCQYGLQAFAKQGQSYQKMLEHFYTGAVVK